MYGKGQPLELLRREAGMRWHAIKALGGMWNTLMIRTWRRAVHCHSSVNVWNGTFKCEWQCDSHCHSAVNVPGSAPYTATRHRACRIGTIRAEWQCWPGRTPNLQPSCRFEGGPTGQMRSGNRPPSRRGLRRGPQASAGGPDRTERRSLSRGPR